MEKMRFQNHGWKGILLLVLAFSLIGCSRRAEVYTAGVQAQKLQRISEDDTEGTEALPQEDSADAETNAEPMDERKPEGYVYVCGAVKQPGVYSVYEGARIFEAIELAGGFAKDADREWLNQAELLQDGQRLYVYTQEETRAIAKRVQVDGRESVPVLWAEDVRTEESIGLSGNGGASGSVADTVGNAGADESADGQKVNLNTADRERLKTLPGIGDAKADAIMQYREEHGSFESIEEVQNISGIKSAVFSKIRDLITV